MMKFDHLALPGAQLRNITRLRTLMTSVSSDILQIPLRGLDPRIHALPSRSGTTWMAGSSPATGNQGCTAQQK